VTFAAIEAVSSALRNRGAAVREALSITLHDKMEIVRKIGAIATVGMTLMPAGRPPNLVVGKNAEYANRTRPGFLRASLGRAVAT
jgi:hypothetical protein